MNAVRPVVGRMSRKFNWPRSHPLIRAWMVSVEHKSGVKQDQMIYYAIGILTTYSCLGWTGRSICHLISFVLPAYGSFLAIRSANESNATKWVIYWIIYALLGFLEYFLLYFLTALRIYWAMKGLFCTWLMMPESASGVQMLYVRFIRPLIIKDIQVTAEEPHEVFENVGRASETPDATDPKESETIEKALNAPKNSDQDHRLLIGQFYTSGDMEIPIKVLESEHFQVTTVKDESQFIAELQSKQYSTAWVLSSSIIYDKAFIPALIDFHHTGGALFLLADNEPYLSHASEFLYRRFDMTLTGTYLGNRILDYQNDGYRLPGAFGQHEIFTGIKTLFEGVTICAPVFSTSKNETGIATVATGTQGHACIAVFDPPAGSTEGRLCLDCGFTKLFINWNAIETARYVVNVSNWLAGKSVQTVVEQDNILNYT